MALGNPEVKTKKLQLEKKYLKEKEFLKRVAKETELTQGKVKEVYEVTANIITEENISGRKVVVPGLGTFKPKYTAPSTREGIKNPSTKERGTINVSEKYSIKFVAKKALAEEYSEKGLKAGLINTHAK